ncbi:MAG: helix-turn-helix domain-containing protein [Candidatus Nanohaloarchaea archaeon]
MRDLDTETLIDMYLSRPGVESDEVEFKGKEILEDNEGRRKIAKTVSAMTNTEGGVILIGVRNEKEDKEPEFFEFETTNEHRLDLTNTIRDNTVPKMDDRVEFNFEDYSGNKILRIDVEKGFRKLIRFQEGEDMEVYKRADSSNRKMEKEEIAKWRKTRFSGFEHELNLSEEIVKKSGAYAEGGYSFDAPEVRQKFEDEEDYFFIERNSSSFRNILFDRFYHDHLTHWWRSTGLDLSYDNYDQFLYGIKELIPLKEDSVVFSISQEEGNWAGFGFRNFVECIRDMEPRYEEYHKNHDSHSSEKAVITAETRFGRISIVFYYYIGEGVPIFRRSELILSTEGIPYNTYPLSVFLEAFGAELVEGRELPDDRGHIGGLGFEYAEQGTEGPEVDVIQKIKLQNPGLPEMGERIGYVLFENPYYGSESKEKHSRENDALNIIRTVKHLIGKVDYPVPVEKDADYYLKRLSVKKAEQITGSQCNVFDIEIELELENLEKPR